jgi:hypothetical protein
MRNSRIVVGIAGAAIALVMATTASAAYSTAKLSITYGSGGSTRIVASSDGADDATARAAIVIANGTTLTTTAAPGTKVGTVTAQVSALALGGALLPLAGDILVAPPGAVPAASQTACIGAATPSATYLLVLQAAGQTINLPAYIIPTDGAQAAIGAAQLVFCLAPPDVPVDKGGATFGAKFLAADMTFAGVFSPLANAVWMGFWTPWTPLTGVVNAAGTVASPAIIGASAVSLKGKRVKGRVTLTGVLSTAGAGFGGTVRIWGRVGKAALKPLKSVTANDKGVFKLTLPASAKQKSFQARFGTTRASLGGSDAASFCTDVFSSLPVPCSTVGVQITGANSKLVTVR